MELKDIKNVSVEIYKGRAFFAIHCGSYKYRDILYVRKKLSTELISEDDNYFILGLIDSKAGKVGSLTAMRVDDKIKIKVQLTDHTYNRVAVILPSDRSEHFYGCGATYSKFDLKGERVRIWSAEHQNSLRLAKKSIRERVHGVDADYLEKFGKYESYFVQPICVSSKKYFIFVDTSKYMEFDFRNERSSKIFMHGSAEIVIGSASSYERIATMISEIVGKASILPDWIYDGMILGIQRGVDEYKRKLQRIAGSNMAVKAIYCRDWSGFIKTEYGYHVNCNWSVDTKLYPNLRGEIVELHENGMKFIGYINPFIIYGGELFKEASEKGYLVKNKRGKDYVIKILSFFIGMLDLTNPQACTWFKDIIKNNMVDIGMDGWFADYGEYLPVNCQLYDGSDPYEAHNKWPLLWARLNREVVVECNRERDIVVFSRSGFMNSMQYSSMMNTGYHHVDWSKDYGLPSAIPAVLSMGLSGSVFNYFEIGGQIATKQMTRTDENLIRWAEMAAFSPLMFTEEGNYPTRNYQFDDSDEIRKNISTMSRIHVLLGDYLKLLEREALEQGFPMIRPLFFHYDEEKAYTEKYEYMLGRDILVAPVIEEDNVERTVYLPQDTWIQLFTGLVFQGGFITVRTPFGRPPVFVRANSPYKSELLEIQKNL